MEPEQVKKFPIRLIIILLILIIVLIVTLIFINLSVVSVSVIKSEPEKSTFRVQSVSSINSIRNGLNAHLPFDVSIASGEKLSYPQENFYFNVLPSWSQIATSTVVLPNKITNPLFALTSKNLNCVIAYAEFPKQLKNGDIYNQTRYSYQFSNTDDLISVNRAVDSRYFNPNDLKLTQDSTPYLPYEIAYSYYPYNNLSSGKPLIAFVLFMPDANPVPERCDEDFVSMLSSLTRYYDSTTIAPSSQGDLFIKVENNNGKVINRLLFKDTDTKISKEIKELGSISSSVVVYDNKLFYINSNGFIFSLDPISKQEEKVFDLPPSEQLTDNKINNFYIYKNRLFYLYGPSCLDYLAECNLQLYEYDMITKKSSLLADDLVDRSILAYDKAENRLYLMYSDGDGGCGWWHNDAYDFSLEKIFELDKGSHCEGDPDLPGHDLLMNKIRNLQNTQVKDVQWLHVSGNKLLLPQSEFSPSGESLSSMRYITSSP